MASSFDAEASKFDRSAKKSPPVGWSAAKSQSYFQDGRTGTLGMKNLPDGLGPQGGGGSTGPALPFRIIEGNYLPKATGARTVFTMARPRKEEPTKADCLMFQY
mmetsp:Transcript_106684/g.296929  ORF Transcript_106684/g.296929 Transcript_106684/m.296929 type:complete len:104 (+) Transcript_106684:59-370(+)